MGRKKISRYKFDEEVTLEEKLKKVLTIFELDRSAQILGEVTKLSQKEKLSYHQFLDRLFEEELNRREDSRIERWKKQAKFPWEKTLEDYDFTYPKYIEKEVVLSLAKCDWIKNGGNLVFFGASGVGKTHLSIGLGLQAIFHGYETRFITVHQLSEMVRVAIQKDRGNESGEHRKKLLNLFMNVPLLILDDLAHARIEPSSTEFLFQLFYGRYDTHKSTILTGNENFQEWEKSLFSGNKAQTMAVVDRFLEDCVVISIKGDSYRGSKAIKRKIKENKVAEHKG
jgi:DNA replication protein DnaC